LIPCGVTVTYLPSLEVASLSANNPVSNVPPRKIRVRAPPAPSKTFEKDFACSYVEAKKAGKLVSTCFANGVGKTHWTRFASQTGSTHVMHGMHPCMEGRCECMVVSPSGLAAPCMSVFCPLV